MAWAAERAGHERVVFTGFSVTPPPGDDWRVAPGRLLRAGPDLWVSDSKRHELVLFDVSTGNPKPRRIPSPEWPLAMVEGGGAIWAATFHGGVILRLDPA